LRVKPVAS